MPENKNEILLSLVSDLSRRRKRIMKKELGLAARPEKEAGAPREKRLFPPDMLSQRGHHSAAGEHRSGPPMARLRILSTLLELDGVSQSKLAVILSIRPQSLSELLGKMEGDGVISRVQNVEDKREVVVRITEAGRAKIASYEEERRRYAESFFAPLTDGEKEQLAVLLGKLLENE